MISWDTSKVTNMSGLFFNTSFNQPLNSWNVSKVTDMAYMFIKATNFNQPLNSWNVSNVTNINHMFNNATSFNQNLSTWTTGLDGLDSSTYENFSCESLLLDEAYFPKSSTNTQFSKYKLGCS